ncbi:hypothetical protein M422DRAFT_256820 [Sphaerobolus stellatus SS14]|uniref:Unplaced genomic scaffold SPHSTscaffold_70, whole genome shotgun sequence n=1 Tax=Sphaerobolus stellatus (strain SS14) TaxID=990650 RepID=A0A0C9VPZ0_SPHS4|nr:hypothetical protein M422DRAFT_256820 [Sphaerobolus stellatus SS14]
MSSLDTTRLAIDAFRKDEHYGSRIDYEDDPDKDHVSTADIASSVGDFSDMPANENEGHEEQQQDNYNNSDGRDEEVNKGDNNNMHRPCRHVPTRDNASAEPEGHGVIIEPAPDAPIIPAKVGFPVPKFAADSIPHLAWIFEWLIYNTATHKKLMQWDIKRLMGYGCWKDVKLYAELRLRYVGDIRDVQIGLGFSFDAAPLLQVAS